MKRIFEWITTLMTKRPMKVLLLSIAITLILIAGISKIRLATGNDTMVKTTSQAYQSNLKMEQQFGSDAIVVLFEAKKQKDLISMENIQKMWNAEQEIKHEENIFTVMSPASIVHQIADKQGIEIKNRIKDISDGLDEMSAKMNELGNELKGLDIKDPNEIKSKIEDLSKSTSSFDKLISAQLEMAKGTAQLQSGTSQIANGIGQVSVQLQQLGLSVANNPQLSQQLQLIATNLNKSSQGLQTISDSTILLKQGNDKTAEALMKIKTQLGSQTKEMTGSFGDTLSPEQLTKMADGFLNMGEKLGDISTGLNTFYDKSGMMIADIPTEQKELNEILYENGELRSMFSEVILDNNQAMLIVKLNGNLSNDQKDSVYQELNKTLSEEDFKTISYMISGKPVLDNSLRLEMLKSMKNMVILAIAVMLLVLVLVFKARWRIISLPIIFFVVVATIGLMGFLNIPMTMVSMAVFPILIGLGVDYAIQFQNRYEEERSLKKTLKHMGPAVGTAVIATILGFIALYMSPVPMIKDFGKMLTIGVAISYLAGIFILMAILYLRDHYFPENRLTEVKKEVKPSLLERGLKKSTYLVTKFSFVVIILALTVTIWGVWADRKVGIETDIETFMPQDTPQLKDIHKLRDVLGSTDQVAIVIQDKLLITEKNLNWIDQKSEGLKNKYPDMISSTKSLTTLIRNSNNGKMLDIKDSQKFIKDLSEEQKKMFLTHDQKESVILLDIKHAPVEQIKSFIRNLEIEIKNTDLNVTVTGKSVLDVEMIDGLTAGRLEMTLIGMGLVFFGLLLIYRNPVRALIPIMPISLIVGLSGGIMYLLGMKYTPLTATLGALIIGIGTEFTILLLERYLEERENGEEKLVAIQTAVAKIGKAIIASGLTVIGGFSALVISNFVILKDFGLMTLINMSLALFSTLVVLPPLLVLLDRWIVRKNKFSSHATQTEQK